MRSEARVREEGGGESEKKLAYTHRHTPRHRQKHAQTHR